MKSFIVSFFIAILVISSQSSLANQPNNSASSDKQNTSAGSPSVTVIADVHGDYPTMFELLEAAKIINAEGKWIANNRVLISLGDLVDRGPDSRQILDFFMRLQQEAKLAGGAFKMALGNHEVMNIRGDLRYVSKAEFAAFSNDEPKGVREEVYADFLKYSDLSDNQQSKNDFLKIYPPGFFGHVEAYAPEGKYGSWLLKQNIILKHQGKLFAHGGYSQQLVETGKTIESLNQQYLEELTEYSRLWRQLIDAGLFKYYFDKREQRDVATALVNGKIRNRSLNRSSTKIKARKFLKLYDSMLFDTFGPTWYRGNMLCHEFVEENTVANVLNHFSANQIFLGHTPDKSKTVRSRLNGRVVMLDTGMSKAYYKGNPSLVNIQNNTISVFNLNDPTNTAPTEDPVRKPLNPNGLSDSYLFNFYSNATVIQEKELGDFYTKPKKLTFKHKGKTHSAIFKYLDTDPKLEKRWKRLGNFADRFIYEMAAYKLDRLIGLQMVPFAMEYKYQGKSGVLQYWVEDSISKTQLIENKEALRGYCSERQSRELMQIFDWLIFNEDRNTGNELYTLDDGQLWLIDHTRSFRVTKKLIDNDRFKIPSQLSSSYKNALDKLTEENLQDSLKKYLNSAQIKAILKRRDLILARFNN